MPASFILASSIDFWPELRMSSRSASVRPMSSPTVLMPSRLRQLYDRTVRSSSSIGRARSAARCPSCGGGARSDVGALGGLGQLAAETEQLDQGRAGRRQRGTGRDGRLRLDVDDQTVE